jgi:hypothetical protein
MASAGWLGLPLLTLLTFLAALLPHILAARDSPALRGVAVRNISEATIYAGSLRDLLHDLYGVIGSSWAPSRGRRPARVPLGRRCS